MIDYAEFNGQRVATIYYQAKKSLARLKDCVSYDHFSRKPLDVQAFENAIVVPGGRSGGGIFHHDAFVSGAMVHRGWWNDTRLKKPETILEDDSSALYLGCFYSCWGHCLTDGLKHAWVFLPGVLERFVKQDVKIVYVTSGPGEKLYENFLAMLELVGIQRSRLVRIERPTRFKKVFFPEESYWLDQKTGMRMYSQEYLNTIEHVRRKVLATSSSPSKVIYFSRSGWNPGSRDFGEKIVEEAICERLKCERYRPETLSIQAQIRTLSCAKMLVVTEGSCALNAVFLPKGSELVILRKGDWLNGYQFAVNQASALKVTWLEAFGSEHYKFPSQPWRGPFYICITKILGDYFGIRPRRMWGDYIRYLNCVTRQKTRRFLSFIKHDLILRRLGS